MVGTTSPLPSPLQRPPQEFSLLAFNWLFVYYVFLYGRPRHAGYRNADRLAEQLVALFGVE